MSVDAAFHAFHDIGIWLTPASYPFQYRVKRNFRWRERSHSRRVFTVFAPRVSVWARNPSRGASPALHRGPPDYYAVLGIPRGAAASAVRARTTPAACATRMKALEQKVLALFHAGPCNGQGSRCRERQRIKFYTA